MVKSRSLCGLLTRSRKRSMAQPPATNHGLSKAAIKAAILMGSANGPPSEFPITTSFACELRLALLNEGGHAFLLVLRAEEEVEVLALEKQPLLQGLFI